MLNPFIDKTSLLPHGKLAGALLILALLPGCAALVIATVGTITVMSVEDERSLGSQVDDQTIEFTTRSNIYGDADINQDDHIKVTSYNGVVLLTGETRTEANRQQAEKIAAAVDGTREVINELTVSEASSVGTRLDDSYLTAKVNSVLTSKNPIEGLEAARIKVTTVRDTVYLMGAVTREEADRVVEITRNIDGVGRVIKVFEYPSGPVTP